MNNQKNHPKRWMKLDNAAKIYPSAMSSRWMAIFRLSVELTEKIDTDILSEALRMTLLRFPSLSLRLKRGFFWYYLEQIDEEPEISSDVRNPCARMNFKQNKGYMFRVRYYENKISVEFFHVLTDATGGMSFLKTLTAEYLTRKYKITIPRSDSLLDCSDLPDASEVEDSFIKYAKKTKLASPEAKSYHIEGTPERRGVIHITTAIMDVSQLSAKAKEYNATITEYLLAHLVMSIAEIQKREPGRRKRKQPVKVCVPVNLRKFYPTKTLRNFASFVNIGISSEYGEYTFEEAVKSIHHQMGLETSEKHINARMSGNVSSEKSILIRVLPLFLKDTALKIAYALNGDRTSSTTLSNLGMVAVPEEMKPYVKKFDFLIGPLKTNHVVCACASYNGTLYFNITRNTVEPEVERLFLTSLVKNGIHVKVESNNID
ncbi:MAG: alcohol acetyltransferase [Firmicutes bacterium]|nr:alcohol acetyltransferase [Bacillota bacterium]